MDVKLEKDRQQNAIIAREIKDFCGISPNPKTAIGKDWLNRHCKIMYFQHSPEQRHFFCQDEELAMFQDTRPNEFIYSA
jgi:hypothetical protein